MSQTDSIHPSHFQTSPLGFRHFSGGDAIPQSLRPKTLESSSPPWSLPSPTSGPAGNPAGANLHNIASIWSHAQDALTMKCSFTDLSPHTTEQSATIFGSSKRNLLKKIRGMVDWGLTTHFALTTQTVTESPTWAGYSLSSGRARWGQRLRKEKGWRTDSCG